MAEGVKYDENKLDFSLLPESELEPVIRVMMFGAKKYAPDNWKRVPDAKRRYYNAARRHIYAWFSGERLDPETGESHLAHAICCLLILSWHENYGRDATACSTDTHTEDK